MQTLVEQIDAILPQTQCTRCGYPSCLDYAKAIAEKAAKINQCPPGGDEGIMQLANLMNEPKLPLNPVNGTIKPRQYAIIDEDVCIGCTLCIKACPVDAILGSNKMMHTVITEECTGCDLCVPVCPVDCITMNDNSKTLEGWPKSRRDLAKIRFERRSSRKNRNIKERENRLKSQQQLLKNLQNATSKENLLMEIYQKAKEQLEK